MRWMKNKFFASLESRFIKIIAKKNIKLRKTMKRQTKPLPFYIFFLLWGYPYLIVFERLTEEEEEGAQPTNYYSHTE